MYEQLLKMEKPKYKHLFFDLDRTIYDFDRNNKETLRQIFVHYAISNRGEVDFGQFFEVYSGINKSLWEQYKKRKITKEVLNFRRFKESLGQFGVSDLDPEILAAEYIRISPQMTILVPGALDVLEYLHPFYTLHVITNGFAEIQHYKIKNCNLERYFSTLIISEDAGAQKPDKRIFDFAFQTTGAKPEESLIIGDDPDSDIVGGRNAGMDQAWLSYPGEKSKIAPTYQLKHLLELKEFL